MDVNCYQEKRPLLQCCDIRDIKALSGEQWSLFVVWYVGNVKKSCSNCWGKSQEFSSNDPTHANFRGEEPFSEPETAAVKVNSKACWYSIKSWLLFLLNHYNFQDLILYSGTPFKIFLTFHAYSEVISFPWCFTADPCPDYVTLLEGATTMAKVKYISVSIFCGNSKNTNRSHKSVGISNGNCILTFRYNITSVFPKAVSKAHDTLYLLFVATFSNHIML